MLGKLIVAVGFLLIVSLPAKAAPINCAPLDADGNVFIETWANASNWQTETKDAIRRGTASLGTIHNDDLIMGSNYLLVDSLTPVFSKLMFDHTHYIRWAYRCRVPIDSYYPDAEEMPDYTMQYWVGGGIPFCGEGGWYNGITNSVYGWPILSIYNETTVVDIIQEWNPELGLYRAKLKRLSDSDYGDWHAINTLDATLKNKVWPLSFWYGTENTITNMYMGVVKIKGNPLWGSFDGNFHGWTCTNCGNIQSDDRGFGNVGGLIFCRTLSGVDQNVGYGNYDGEFAGYHSERLRWPFTPNASFSATSPVVELAADTAYSKLWLQTYLPSGGSLGIYLRDSVTHELIPDDYVPGNSQGIISAGTMHPLLTPGTPGQTATIQELDISHIPAGTTFYVDMQGVTPVSGYSPRLGGVWVTFNYTAPAASTYTLKDRTGKTIQLKNSHGETITPKIRGTR